MTKNKSATVSLPCTQEEFTYWKISQQCQDLYSVLDSENTWNWIIEFGIPLFKNSMEFIVEQDAGLGFYTDVFIFDGVVILVSTDNPRYSINDLEKMFNNIDYIYKLI